MLKKTVTYTDFLDEERTEDFYFNISKAELLDIQIGEEGTFTDRLEKIVASKDMRQILDVFKSFIKDSYGIRSMDGRSFVKSQEAWDNFQGSGAYDAMFMEFFSNIDAATAFVNGIMPAQLVDEVNAQVVGTSVPAAPAPAVNGFRPDAQTLPQSRRDSLAAQAEANTVAASVTELQASQQGTPTPVAGVMTAADVAELQALRAAQANK